MFGSLYPTYPCSVIAYNVVPSMLPSQFLYTISDVMEVKLLERRSNKIVVSAQ